ncbi:hypothetical protein P3T76_007319 [Phytophthora citrophthora]|uniref:Uncharacterized protein n=1 Tax=Phytophthora citrophthora TaxID=4793 RepID=A0AAD9LLN8_9STRA|nr:hypothetical protein P3T76_007319 [Phytophthora citrophthora]
MLQLFGLTFHSLDIRENANLLDASIVQVTREALVGGFSNRIRWNCNPVLVHVKTFNVSTLGVCPADTLVSVPD